MENMFELIAKDGHKLACSFFPRAGNEDLKDVLVIQSAVGVKRGFYSPMANFFSQGGYDVYTMDYRGIGDSGDPRNIDDGIHTWATLDLKSLHSYIENKHSNSKLHIIGHSAGGWLLGFIPSPQNLQSVTLLNVGSGYFNSFPFPMNLKMYLNWQYLLPREVKKNGLLLPNKHWYGVALPGYLALSWAKMGLMKGFMENATLNPRGNLLQSYKMKKLAISFSDDAVIPLKAIEAILKIFDSESLNHYHLKPKEINESQLGHFGILKPKQKKNLWPRILNWMKEGKF